MVIRAVEATAGSIEGSFSAAVTWSAGECGCAERGGCASSGRAAWSSYFCAAVRPQSSAAPPMVRSPRTCIGLGPRAATTLRLYFTSNSVVTVLAISLVARSRSRKRSREVKPRWKLFFSVADAATFSAHIPLEPSIYLLEYMLRDKIGLKCVAIGYW